MLEVWKEIADVYPVDPQAYHQIFARGVFMQIDGGRLIALL